MKFETPNELRKRLAAEWKKTEGRLIAGDIDFPYDVSIKSSPASRAAHVSATVAHHEWAQRWAGFPSPGAVLLIEEQHACRGHAPVPLAISFQDEESLLSFLPDKEANHTRKLKKRLRSLGYRLPIGKAAVLPHRLQLTGLSNAQHIALRTLVEWRARTRATDTAVRELPIEGIDTKWIKSRSPLILAIMEDLGLTFADEGSFEERAGFRCDDKRALWMRMHSEDSPMGRDITEIALRPRAFACRPGWVEKVVMVENETTFLSFTPRPGTLLLYGAGTTSISMAEDLPWLGGVEFIYWGDIDVQGYATLDRIRSIHPETKSLLMDPATLGASRAMAVHNKAPVTPPLPHLTCDEQHAYQEVLSSQVRIEQEKLPVGLATQACPMLQRVASQ